MSPATSTCTMVRHSSPQSSSKDPQSPTLSCTSVNVHPTSASASISDDDHHIKPARMGRVIYLEDEDDEDDPFLQQERDEQLSLPTTDNSDKLLLQQSLQIITQLAVMDRDEYQRRLVENSLPVVPAQQISYLDNNTDHSSQHTNNHLNKLTQSLHRFHSLVANLERENDSQTLEIYKLQTNLENVKERNQKLETAVQKLYKRNTKLKKEKTAQSNSIGNKILSQVQKSKSNKKQEQQNEFLKLATQVQQHESLLVRERADSNFSDVDGLEAFYSNNGQDSIDNGDDSMSSEADVSVTTTTSLITDESAATVKISRERTFTWPKLHCEENDKMMVDPVRSKSTTTSPSKKRSSGSILPESSSSNLFAAFLTPKPAQPYTLSFVAPYTLQLVQIPIEAATATTNTSSSQELQYAVCICGYHGFDATANVKPTLGARLLEVNKQKIDPKWTLLEIEKHMKSQGKTTRMTFRNDTWDKKQKEVLTAAVTQQEKLHPNNKPTTTGNMLQGVRKRSQSGESLQKNLLGFLNFNHHNHHAEQRPTTPETKTTPPRPTTTTTTSTQQADVSPIQDMIAFLRTNHIANTTPEEGVTFDDQAAQVAFPTTPEQALQDDTDGTVVVVNLNPKVQPVETDDDYSLATPNLEEKQQSAASSAFTSTIDTATKATISTAVTATAPKLAEVKAADAFKSSMKNMSKLFAFR